MESKKLKVLWIARGNGRESFKPVVKNQFDSLSDLSTIQFFTFVLEGKGLGLYFKNFFKIRKMVRRDSIDIIHAHYSFTGFLCALTFSAPVVVSLMGSDVIASKWRRVLIIVFSRLLWKRVIVKTAEMKHLIGLDEAEVLPNGVDMDFYCPQDLKESKDKLGWSSQEYHIVFPSDIARQEKNFQLLKEAIQLLNDDRIHVHEMKGLSKGEVRDYFAAADLVVMTSTREGSPNAIKEALSMNKCIISTRVGDVEGLIQGVQGTWLVAFDPNELATRIDYARAHHFSSSNGRLAIERLSAPKVAEQLKFLYFSCQK